MTDNKSIVDLYTKVISEQTRKEQGIVSEAASKGTTKETESGINHTVIHNDGKGNHLTATYHNEEPGAVLFHGKMGGQKIRVDAEGENGRDPGKADISSALKSAHPKLPDDLHKKIVNAAHSGMKKLGY